MSYSFLQQSIRDGSLVLWHRYDQGTLIDWSGQGNGGTPADLWYDGGGLRFSDPDGVVTVPDASELQLTEGSIFILGDFMALERTPNESVFVSKEDGGGINYEFDLDATPRFLFADGVATRVLNTDYRGSKSVAVTFEDGETPIGYVDGLSVGTFNGSVTITTDDADLKIGNRYPKTRSVYNPIWNVCIWNDILDGAEIAEAHGELVELARGSA